jgi:hypothetical protein
VTITRQSVSVYRALEINRTLLGVDTTKQERTVTRMRVKNWV